MVSNLMLPHFALGPEILSTKATLPAAPPVPQKIPYLGNHVLMISSQEDKHELVERQAWYGFIGRLGGHLEI